MKSITKSGFGIGILVFAAAVILALPLRTLQYFTVLESETGFFTKNDWSVYLLGIVLFAAIIFSVVFGFIKRKTLDYSLETVKRPGQGILSYLVTSGMLMNSASIFIQLMNSSGFSDEAKTSNLLLGVQAVFCLLVQFADIQLGQILAGVLQAVVADTEEIVRGLRQHFRKRSAHFAQEAYKLLRNKHFHRSHTYERL